MPSPSSTTNNNTESTTMMSDAHQSGDTGVVPIRAPTCLQVFLRNLTPSWFTISMGTGIVSILLHNLPYNSKGLYWVSIVIFVLNLILFILLAFFSILRYVLYPGLWITMIRHPAVPMFLGAIPMALATIIEMTALVCVPVWGGWAAYLCWGLWWFDVVASVTITYRLPFLMMTIHDSHPAQVTAIWLLPMASAIVASAVGGVVAEVLPSPAHAFWTLVVSYVLWGTALPLSMSFLVIYLYRLTMHQIPPRNVVVSCLIPVAPLGQGAFAALQLGKVAAATMGRLDMLGGAETRAGTVLYVLGWFIGLVLWAYGLAWLVLAIASLGQGKFPFNIGCWAFTFPLGVWASAAILFGNELPSPFFRVIGTITAALVTLFWVFVSAGTLKGMYTRQIYVAPDYEEWTKSRKALGRATGGAGA